MKYLTFSDLREKLCGRGRTSIYRDVKLGRLPAPIKLGDRNFWREDEIDAAMAGLVDGNGRAALVDTIVGSEAYDEK